MKRFVNGDEIEFNSESVSVTECGDRLVVKSDGGSFSAVAVKSADGLLISYLGQVFHVSQAPNKARTTTSTRSGELVAPMPGLIVDVRFEVGDSVQKGDTILVLEAMKTQQPFKAPFDGKLADLGVSNGDQVVDGQMLAVVEKLETKMDV